jgi:hypothetical protein
MRGFFIALLPGGVPKNVTSCPNRAS